MVQYAKFGITCTATDSSLIKKYEYFKERCKNYCVDEDMELYYIPVGSETYEYAHNLVLHYPPSEEVLDESPSLYVTESSLIQTKYDKSDFDKAIAYVINFWYFAYDYEDLSPDDFVSYCCDNPSWSIEPCFMQNRDYRIPKSELGKKKFAKLMLGYAVADEVMEVLINARLATEKDFKSVTTKKGIHVCYQIAPEHTISGFMSENDVKLVDHCRVCGKKRYNPCKEPYYMSRKLAYTLHGLNRTVEMKGSIIENTEKNHYESAGCILEPIYIINKDSYNLLHGLYPRMQFIPIFPLV